MGFMLTCKETGKELSTGIDHGKWRRAQVWMHLLMCEKCRAYAEQLRLLRLSAKEVLTRETEKHADAVAGLEQKAIQKNARS